LGFSEALNYAQGVMVHEQLAFDKASPPPFSDQSGAIRFQQSIAAKLDGIWTMMFPYSVQHSEKELEKMKAFSARKQSEKAEGAKRPWWRPWKE